MANRNKHEIVIFSPDGTGTCFLYSKCSSVDFAFLGVKSRDVRSKNDTKKPQSPLRRPTSRFVNYNFINFYLHLYTVSADETVNHLDLDSLRIVKRELQQDSGALARKNL